MQKPVEVKKQRTRRPPQMIAELILEAERNQNQAAICRRENIAHEPLLQVEIKIQRSRNRRTEGS